MQVMPRYGMSWCRKRITQLQLVIMLYNSTKYTILDKQNKAEGQVATNDCSQSRAPNLV